MRSRLAHLAGLRFLGVREADGELVYRYHPLDSETAALIDGLARLYKERRLAVIDLVYGRPESDIQAFSNAFRLKKRGGGP